MSFRLRDDGCRRLCDRRQDLVQDLFEPADDVVGQDPHDEEAPLLELESLRRSRR